MEDIFNRRKTKLHILIKNKNKKKKKKKGSYTTNTKTELPVIFLCFFLSFASAFIHVFWIYTQISTLHNMHKNFDYFELENLSIFSFYLELEFFFFRLSSI
jgi:preprotein translocase subunit SecY